AVAWNDAGNLMDAPPPYAFLPNPPIINDFVLFGIDSSLADSGPFWSLVFDLVTTITGVTTIQWRYSTGGADPLVNWANFVDGIATGLQDNTNADGLETGVAFDTLGVRSVHWEPNDMGAAWTAQNPQVGANPPLGVTGLWVAAVVTAGPGAGVPPIQQLRNIYTISRPSYRVLDNVVQGDISALGHLSLRAQTNEIASRFIIGSRQSSRGEDFEAYINMANEQRPPGVFPGIVGGTSAFAADVTAPCGVVIQANAVPAAWTRIAIIAFSDAHKPQMIGKYLMFLRQYATTAAMYRLFLGDVGSILWTSKEVTVGTARYQLAEFGLVQLPSFDLPNSTVPWDGDIHIEAYGDGTTNLTLYDFIMIPADEWAVDILGQPLGAPLLYWTYRAYAEKGRVLHLDSITDPKNWANAVLRNYSAAIPTYLPSWTLFGRPLTVTPREDLRFFGLSTEATTNVVWAPPWPAGSVQLECNNRYLSMRGSR
ncbi:MAG: hypothetical protein ABIG63_15080, partial [Chloroflexota bacterium]